MGKKPNTSFQRTVKKLRFLQSAEFQRYAIKSILIRGKMWIR
jgi:hypothetical protein